MQAMLLERFRTLLLTVSKRSGSSMHLGIIGGSMHPTNIQCWLADTTGQEESQEKSILRLPLGEMVRQDDYPCLGLAG